MITVERGSSEALEDIVALIGQSFPERYGEAWNSRQLTSIISLPNVSIYMARKHEILVGFAIARSASDECELLLIAVAPTYRRSGVATQLIDRLTADARSGDQTKLFLEMRDGNSAEQLYLRFGFERVGRRANYYNGPDGLCYDAITFAMLL
ncbi:GNAT family N-acetyltransferase [Novosphingopyxis sp.]|uniref:GNAT family N-acetyltransferase n=1 Tax=Novosphingopyxis sp. TaxID=2709690 RepID=UPI003B5D05A4